MTIIIFDYSRNREDIVAVAGIKKLITNTKSKIVIPYSRSVLEIIMHRFYNHSLCKNDIALIRVSYSKMRLLQILMLLIFSITKKVYFVQLQNPFFITQEIRYAELPSLNISEHRLNITLIGYGQLEVSIKFK